MFARSEHQGREHGPHAHVHVDTNTYLPSGSMSEVHVAPHPTCVCVCVFVCVCVRACTNCLGLTNTQGDVCMYVCVCDSGIAPPCRQADARCNRQHQPSACEIHSEFVRNQVACIPRKTRPVRFYIQFKCTHACTHANHHEIRHRVYTCA